MKAKEQTLNPLDGQKSANQLQPVWTNLNHLIVTNKGRNVLLSAQGLFGGSLLTKPGENELESRRPTEGAEARVSEELDLKHYTAA